MNGKCIVWKKPGGEIVLTVPAPRTRMVGEDEEQWFNRLAEKMRANALLQGAQRLPDHSAAELPQRRFRACWRADVQGKIAVDLSLARQQWMAEIRSERNRRLEVSDKAYVQFAETGSAAQRSALKKYRQALREMPEHLELDKMESPVALASYEPQWPEYLQP